MTAEPGPDARRGASGNLGTTGAVLIGAALLALYFVPRTTAGPTSFVAAIEFLLFGFAVGAYGTMVGAGGGFLIVPALLLVYHARPEQATGTSLAVVFLNALSGSWAYGRQGRIDYQSGRWFALATLPGAVAGAFLTQGISGRLFDLVFGVLILLIAGLLIWRPVVEEEYAEALVEEAEVVWWRVKQRITDVEGETYHYRYNMLVGVGLSFVVGFWSSILGIGGGVVHVPVLIHLLGFPAHIAMATSQFILVISALAGAGSHLALGHVLAGPAILMGIGAVGGAQVGARLARRLHGSRLIRLLSLALGLVGLRLLLR
ncbi:MAG: sulfite exporter TauE/SafE family protein [Gemmatimonadales bacterium]